MSKRGQRIPDKILQQVLHGQPQAKPHRGNLRVFW